MSNQISKQSLSDQIYFVLREDILSQRIKCGTKLILQSLKERFDVSHTPIREALTRLVEDELVNSYTNVGVSVVTMSQQDVREILQLCGDFDAVAIKYSCKAHYNEVLRELSDDIALSKKVLMEHDMQAWQMLSDRFHLIFYKYADNSRLNAAAQKLRAQVTLIGNIYQLNEQSVSDIQNQHEEIVDCIRAGDISKAMELMCIHLDRVNLYSEEKIKEVS